MHCIVAFFFLNLLIIQSVVAAFASSAMHSGSANDAPIRLSINSVQYYDKNLFGYRCELLM